MQIHFSHLLICHQVSDTFTILWKICLKYLRHILKYVSKVFIIFDNLLKEGGIASFTKINVAIFRPHAQH